MQALRRDVLLADRTDCDSSPGNMSCIPLPAVVELASVSATLIPHALSACIGSAGGQDGRPLCDIARLLCVPARRTHLAFHPAANIRAYRAARNAFGRASPCRLCCRSPCITSTDPYPVHALLHLLASASVRYQQGASGCAVHVAFLPDFSVPHELLTCL